MNHFMFLEATKAKARSETIYRYQAKFGRAKTAGDMGKAGRTFLDQIQAIRDRYEFARVPNKELALRQQTLQQFVEDQRAAGEELVIDPAVLNENRRLNYREATITELEAVHDAIRNIETVARRQLESIVNGQRVSREEQVSALAQSASAHGKAKPLPLSGSKLSLGERAGSAERYFASIQYRPEQVP